MRDLAATTGLTLAGIEAAVGEVLDRRLSQSAAQPVAVAFSGGGDSLAMLLAADAWARRVGRDLVVLTVDHRLRPQSSAWTTGCAAVAARLGRPFRALIWTHDNPTTGLPAAARAARQALVADGARAAGARVVLIGHTADDVLEARIMRAEGSSVPEPYEWSPSPAWPQGRGLFVARPLLGLARQHIRSALAAAGESWVDDPANTDLAYARARARTRASDADQMSAPPPPAATQGLASATLAEPYGGLSVSRAALRAAPTDTLRRYLSVACLCAAGTTRPPAGIAIDRLAGELLSAGAVAATLAGARIEAEADTVRFLREAGEAARGGLAALKLAPDESGVWDGRFEITANRPIEVRRLAGQARRLPKAEQRALRALPAAARGGLPLMLGKRGEVACPVLTPVRGVEVTPLVQARLLAACGAIDREPA